MDQTLEEKLERLQKEYAMKKRKLKKIKRASTAKAHVKMKLLEQEGLTSHTDAAMMKDEGVSLDKHSSSADHTNLNDASAETASRLPTTPASSNHEERVQGKPECTREKRKTKICTMESKTAAINSHVDNANHTPGISDKGFKPISQKKDMHTNNTSKPQSNAKLSKYRNRKIVTILSPSVTNSCKTGLGLGNAGYPPTDSDGDITSVEDSQVSENMNGNMVSAKPPSNKEAEADAMIYERRPPDLPTAASTMCELSHQGTSENVKKLSKNITNSITADASDKAASSVPVMTMHERLADTESSQCSSAYSDDLFDDDNSLKRRTRKARRRSVNTGKRRHSTRLAELSSQDSHSSTSQNDLRKIKSPVLSGCKVKKKVIISSMFQCLVDEGKRKKDKEFNIPDEFKELKTDDEETTPKAESGQLSKDGCEQRQDLRSPSISEQSNANSDQTGSFSPVLDTAAVTDNQETDLEDKVKDSTRESSRTSPRVDYTTGSASSAANPETGTSIHQTDKETFSENGLPKPEELADTDIRVLVNQSEDDVVDSGCMSPPLFDSQPLVTSLEEQYPVISELSSETDVNKLSGDDSCDAECIEDDKKGDNTASVKDDFVEEINFEQAACFQVPVSDQLLGLETVMAVRCGEPVVYVACLCTTSLKLYSRVDKVWTCIATETHTSPIRKKAMYRLYGWPGLSSVDLVLVLSKADKTSLTHYTYTNISFRHSVTDTVTAKGICSCRLTDHQLIVCQWSGKKTTLVKHRLDTAAGHWSQFDLETCDKKIVAMTTIQQTDMAVAGFTSQGVLHIWNHDCGFLLSTVDLSDICPRDFTCPEILQEQGYLFLPLLTKKKNLEPGTIVVVNPQLNTSEALTTIQAGNQLWAGCSKAAVLHTDLLVAMETSGTLSVLDLFTGGRLATMEGAGVTCFTSNRDTLYLGHKQCVHVFHYSSDLKT